MARGCSGRGRTWNACGLFLVWKGWDCGIGLGAGRPCWLNGRKTKNVFESGVPCCGTGDGDGDGRGEVGTGEAGEDGEDLRTAGRADVWTGRGEGRIRGGRVGVGRGAKVGEGRGARVEVGRGGSVGDGRGGAVGDGRGGRLGEGRGGWAAVVVGRGLKEVTGRGVIGDGPGVWGALVVKEEPGGMLRGSNSNLIVPAGMICVGRDEGAGEGARVGAGRRVVDAWNVVGWGLLKVVDGPKVGAGLAVVPRTVVGAAVVTAPDGTELSRRLICPPPVMLCCS